MGNNKSKYKNGIMKVHRDINHMPINGERFTKFESVKNKTSENIVENMEPISPIVQKTRREIVENTHQTSEYAVDFVSKTFGPIKLKEVRDPGYTANDIKVFFAYFDFVDNVIIRVDDPSNPYVDHTSLLTVALPQSFEKYTISTQLFWKCLPADVREKFKRFKNHFLIFSKMFSAYKKKMIIKKLLT